MGVPPEIKHPEEPFIGIPSSELVDPARVRIQVPQNLPPATNALAQSPTSSQNPNNQRRKRSRPEGAEKDKYSTPAESKGLKRTMHP